MTALGNLEANTQLLNSHSQSIAKLEGQVGQLANPLNQRKEGKLPSQPVANPQGQYMVDGSASGSVPHEQVQAVTTLRSGRVVDNKVGLKAQEKDDSPLIQIRPLAVQPLRRLLSLELHSLNVSKGLLVMQSKERNSKR